MEINKIKNLFPEKVKLRNQKIMTLRLMEDKDIDGVFNFFTKILSSEKIYLKENVTDKGAIVKWARRIKDHAAVTILGEIEGTICAEATLHQQAAGWSKHVGDIRINVSSEHRGIGISTMLCDKICWIARILKISKVMAEVIPEQKKAIKIFENFGFEKEAILKDHVIDIEGKLHNLIILANHTEKLIKEIHSHIFYTDPRFGPEY